MHIDDEIDLWQQQQRQAESMDANINKLHAIRHLSAAIAALSADGSTEHDHWIATGHLQGALVAMGFESLDTRANSVQRSREGLAVWGLLEDAERGPVDLGAPGGETLAMLEDWRG